MYEVVQEFDDGWYVIGTFDTHGDAIRSMGRDAYKLTKSANGTNIEFKDGEKYRVRRAGKLTVTR